MPSGSRACVSSSHWSGDEAESSSQGQAAEWAPDNEVARIEKRIENRSADENELTVLYAEEEVFNHLILVL